MSTGCNNGSSGGDWNPGNDGNVFKNRSPKFKFVTIIKDNNISVNVGSACVETEQCCPEEEKEKEHGKPCGGGTRPRMNLTSYDNSAVVEDDVASILEEVVNDLESDGETNQPTTKKFKSDLFNNIMKMFEDSTAY